MGGDKHGSKSGRYVGGFLQLFDWNAKSRKKLFSSKSDFPENPKQGKRGEESFPMSRMRVDEEDEYSAFGGGFSVRGGSDYSCASSVTDDDGYGTKAPGVVARLMGLDSLPTSNAMDPYSISCFDSISLQEAPFRGRNLDFYQHHHMMHSTHLSGKMEASIRNDEMETRSLKLPNRSTEKLQMEASTRNNKMETRSLKLPNRPIEKFQTDTLPQKSSKTIPITHHKLLSPIKSPIFVPSQDAAHIMEAAAKIIEPGPSATPRAKISSAGSSTVPFKVREMREKLEATQRQPKTSEPSQRPVESNAAKYLKGQPMNTSWNGLVETTSFRASPSREDSSAPAKRKGKSISLAIQAKVNVQKREGLGSSSKSVGESEDQDDNKSSQSLRNQSSSGPKFSNRKSSNKSTSSVLRQNNQKQNCPSHENKPAPKSSVTTKKALSEDTSLGRQKSVARESGASRTNSRKSSLHVRDTSSDKGVPYGGVRNVPRKKRSIDGTSHLNKNQVGENMMFVSKHEKPSQSSVVADKQFAWIEESRRKGMDVVSFTFTAPITRSHLGSESSRQLVDKASNIGCDDGSNMLSNSDLSRLSSPGLSGIKGDALSKLLEQKLKELTFNLETSHCTSIKPGTATDSVQKIVVPGSAESATGKTQEKTSQKEPLAIDMNSELFANEVEQLKRKFNFEVGEAMEKYSFGKAEVKKWNDSHSPSPVSILEPSTLTESYCSSESMASSITEESKQSSSVQAQEVIGSSSSQKLQAMETETDISDSASSTSQITAEKYPIISTAWELGYVKDILCNVELMFKDYVAGRTREIVNPHLFDQMERRRGGGKDKLRLERKMLFDCVSECLDLKCQRFVGGGFEMWAKGIATLKRKERLAEEVYKEILVWRNLGNSMVDELVDKDMSSKYGRWLDFEVDEFMVGVEIEDQIVDSLVGEMVSEILSQQCLGL